MSRHTMIHDVFSLRGLDGGTIIEYDAWVKAAAEKRDRCVVGELPYKEFAGWIDGTSRQR